MKKSILIILLVFVFSLVGCKKSEKPTLLVPAGSPLIAVAGMLEYVNYEVTTGPSLLPSEFIKGEKDIIVAPVIVGAKLYNVGSSKYKLAAVIGFSNLYIVSRTPLTSINDLNGEKMLAFGEYATPGIVLKQVTQNINVDIEWGSDIKEMIAPFKTKRHNYVLISEPALTTLKNSLKEEVYVLSLKDLFQEEIIQVGVFINPNSTKNLSKTLNEIKKNIEYLNKNNVLYAKNILNVHEQLTEFGEETISDSILNLDLKYKNALNIKEEIEAFLTILNEYNKELLGDKLPNNEFYYE
ncbi:MAG: hypothetical protein ACOX02_05755 [Acholeplasmatales bacterium]